MNFYSPIIIPRGTGSHAWQIRQDSNRGLITKGSTAELGGSMTLRSVTCEAIAGMLLLSARGFVNVITLRLWGCPSECRSGWSNSHLIGRRISRLLQWLRSMYRSQCPLDIISIHVSFHFCIRARMYHHVLYIRGLRCARYCTISTISSRILKICWPRWPINFLVNSSDLKRGLLHVTELTVEMVLYSIGQNT